MGHALRFFVTCVLILAFSAVPVLAQATSAAGRLSVKETVLEKLGPGVVLGSVRVLPSSQVLVYVEKRDGKERVVVGGVAGKEFEQVGYDSHGSRMGWPSGPDSQHVAYVARSAEGWHAVVGGMEGKSYEKIEFLQLSADGQHFAYVATQQGKRLIVHDGKEGKAYEYVSPPRLSPDGTRVAYEAFIRKDGERFIVVDDWEGPGYHSVGDPVFSPDGRRIAYTAFIPPQGKVGSFYLAVVDGVEGKRYPFVVGLCFSPDSRHVVYGAFDSTGGRIVIDGVEGPSYSTGVGGTQPYLLGFRAVFSPNGERMAYAVGRPDRKGACILDGVEQPSYDESSRFRAVSYLTFSPDGKRFAYRAQRVQRSRGVTRTQRRTGDTVEGFDTHVVLEKAKSFVVLDGKEGSEQGETWGLTFSPDGRRLAYLASRDRNLYLIVEGAGEALLGPTWTHHLLSGIVFHSPTTAHIIIRRDDAVIAVEVTLKSE